jgi:hypothetical protein
MLDNRDCLLLIVNFYECQPPRLFSLPNGATLNNVF